MTAAAKMGGFTPGPWAVLGDDCRKRVTAHYVREIRAADGTFVADVGSFGNTKRFEHDARLIAAAPEMFAALPHVLADWRHHDDAEFEDGEMSAIDACRAAIAKAQGGES